MALKLKSSGGLDNLSLPGKLAVGLVFTLMVGAAYFVVFYGEVNSSITAQETALVSKRTELTKANEAKAAYNKDLAEKARREAKERKQKKILPDSAEMPAFLATLQTQATITGVTLTQWTPNDEAPARFYARVPMQVKLQGKFHQVAKFFYSIGQVDRIINMEDIVMTIKDMPSKKKEGEPESATVEVACLATAFRALAGSEVSAGGKKRRRR